MDLPDLIGRLERTAATYDTLLRGLDEERVRWSPRPEAWSLLLVVCHLADEERDDFKPRLAHVLEGREGDFTSIDPEGWVTSRDYAGQEYEASLDRFLAERARSLEWLRGLDAPDWSLEYEHPALGVLSAGDLMASWVAHDLLHMRQVLKLLHDSLLAEVEPHGTEYAGPW